MSQDVLAGIPLFAQLPPEDRAALEGMLEEKKYPANRPVVWLGEKGDSFYIVRHGSVSVSCPDESGKEVVLGKLGPSHFFGEISLLDGGPRTANVRTLVDTTLLSLNRENFLHFLLQHPHAAIHMLTILGQRQRETLDKVRGIRNVNDAVAQTRTRWQVIAERIATITATQWFVLLNLLFFGVWIVINLALPALGRKAWDEAPFGLLGFIITVEALFISLFVLISQGQQGDRDRIRADLDYQINLKAHQEVMQLHQKVDRLQQAVAGAVRGVAATGVAESA